MNFKGLISTFGLPVATMASTLLGGINFFHNIVQEDVLREHKKLLDGLRTDIDAIQGFDATDITGNFFARR